MAGRLLEKGFVLTVWNRTAAKAEELVKKGARRAGSPGEAAAGADAVITIVANDDALRQVTRGEAGLLAAVAPGAVHLSMSTVSAGVTEELAAAHRENGAQFLAAPVFGSRESAGVGKLWGAASGPREVFERCRPVLEALTQQLIYLDENVASAARMKIVVNSLISAATAAMAQTFTLAERSGLEADKLMEVIRAVFNSPVYERWGSKMAAREYSVYFPLSLMLKDVNLVLQMGAEAGVSLPHAAATREMIVAGVGQGYGEADAATALLRAWEAACGASPAGRESAGS